MSEYNRRILIVDDNPSIQNDFRKLLAGNPGSTTNLDAMEDALFGSDETNAGNNAEDREREIADQPYELDYASQGQEALNKVRQAAENNHPYAVVFMDVRMPPGWDGIETISRIWAEVPHVEMVICTAYSDYTWDEILAKVGEEHKPRLLPKPVEPDLVKDTAFTLVKKWNTRSCQSYRD